MANLINEFTYGNYHVAVLYERESGFFYEATPVDDIDYEEAEFHFLDSSSAEEAAKIYIDRKK